MNRQWFRRKVSAVSYREEKKVDMMMGKSKDKHRSNTTNGMGNLHMQHRILAILKGKVGWGYLLVGDLHRPELWSPAEIAEIRTAARTNKTVHHVRIDIASLTAPSAVPFYELLKHSTVLSDLTLEDSCPEDASRRREKMVICHKLLQAAALNESFPLKNVQLLHMDLSMVAEPSLSRSLVVDHLCLETCTFSETLDLSLVQSTSIELKDLVFVAPLTLAPSVKSISFKYCVDAELFCFARLPSGLSSVTFDGYSPKVRNATVAQTIVNALDSHDSIVKLDGLRFSNRFKSASNTVQHFLKVNQYGRRLVRAEDTSSLALWPRVLARPVQENEMSVVFDFLRMKPDLVRPAKNSRKRSAVA